MWRLALDQNFNLAIFNEVKRKHSKPDLDVVRLFEVGLSKAPDEAVLDWAAEQRRIVVTHDVKTMVPLANSRIRAGLPMPGIIVVRFTATYTSVVEDMCILLDASTPDEWEGRIAYLPY